MAIKLGQEVKDKVTGFTGIVVARTKYLNGCDRLSVQPKSEKNELPDCKSFDEPDLVFVGNGILPEDELEKPKTRNGGPHGHSFEAR